MSAKYDKIGIDYSRLRRPDWRIEKLIHERLGDARTVLNVGAGAGSYEPLDREITAVEPSAEMIKQRSDAKAKVIQGVAEKLPFDDNSFDASMAVLTIHHWQDQGAGLQEMRRVTKGPMVLVTFDPSARPWLTDYLPELIALDEDQMPKMAQYGSWLGSVEIEVIPIPYDCSDGFLYSYWRRPLAYCDPGIRPAISSFWAIENAEAGLTALKADLDSGAWAERYRSLQSQESYDAGYRLVVSN
jgi:SAM-dependent methyltransferase